MLLVPLQQCVLCGRHAVPAPAAALCPRCLAAGTELGIIGPGAPSSASQVDAWARVQVPRLYLQPQQPCPF